MVKYNANHRTNKPRNIFFEYIMNRVQLTSISLYLKQENIKKDDINGIVDVCNKLINGSTNVFKQCSLGIDYKHLNSPVTFNINTLRNELSLATPIVNELLAHPNLKVKNKAMQMAISLIMLGAQIDQSATKLFDIRSNYKNFTDQIHNQLKVNLNDPVLYEQSIGTITNNALDFLKISENDINLKQDLKKVITCYFKSYRDIKNNAGIPEDYFLNNKYISFISNAIIWLAASILTILFVNYWFPINIIKLIAHEYIGLSIPTLNSKSLFALVISSIAIIETIKYPQEKYLNLKELLKDLDVELANNFNQVINQLDFSETRYRDLIGVPPKTFGEKMFASRFLKNTDASFSIAL